MRKHIDPQHPGARSVLRILGPGIALTGLVLTVVGIGSFFSSFGSFEPPRYFWCAFLGLPLVGVGLMLTKFAFLGAISRYMANEVAPVGKDTFNYMAEGTTGSVRELASAVGEGFRAGTGGEVDRTVYCEKCGDENDATANFCKSCGNPMPMRCPDCAEVNEPDARFCDNCGRTIG